MRHLLLALLACLPLTALAWNGAGHRLVAAMAWREMSPAAQGAAGDLLARHPDHRQWVAKAGADPAYTAFVESSTWPDDIRGDPRFQDEATSALPAPGFPDNARHKAWHYVDYTPDGRVRNGELHLQLDRLARLLADPRAPAADRAYALPWLIHLVADAHQPLHVGSRDDEGGNRVDVEDPFNPRMPVISLHAWWDDLPGRPWMRGQRLEKVATALLADHPTPPQGSPSDWLKESRALSRETVYPDAGDGPRPAITADFRARARVLANRRLVEAGHRLARLLEGVLGGVSRGTER